MIPARLKMRNFMCYRNDVELSFAGIHTACITGDNGNGKSALIDAMTWALWGESRAKSDDDLVYQGEAGMLVEFDFAIGDQLYRIIRKHARPKRQNATGLSSLDLLVLSGAEGLAMSLPNRLAANGAGYQVVSGDSKRQTQQKINGILHMDYDTFVNSAYLRQGHAGEFTEQPPARRKDVLSNILQLSHYDGLEEQAKESARRLEAQNLQLEKSLAEIMQELAQKPACEAEFVQVQGELSEVEKVVDEQQTALNQLRVEKQALEQNRAQLVQLTERIQEKERDLARWEEQSRQRLSRVQEFDDLLSHRSEIENGYAQFIDAKKACNELNQKLGLLLKLNERKVQLEKSIEQAQAKLLTQQTVIHNRVTELTANSEKAARYKDELMPLESQKSHLAEQEEALLKKRQDHQELQAKLNYLESDRFRLERETKEIDEKLGLLLTQSDARCPLCGVELGLEGRKHIEDEYNADRKNKMVSIKTIEAEIRDKQKELQAVVSGISQLENRLNQDRAVLLRKEALLHKGIEEAEEASQQLVQEQKSLAEVERLLASRSFAVNEQKSLAALEEELERLGYDGERHEETRKQLAATEKYEAPKRRLEEAERSISGEKEALAQAEEVMRQLHLSLEADHQRSEALSVELTGLPLLESRFIQAETAYRATVMRQKEVQQQLGSVKAKLERLAELEVRKNEKEELHAQSEKEAAIYQTLAKAFGKNGIQAWLIERVVPEIEVEADKLLAKMTDNRMHVKIETQRETRKGDTVEALEIDIADELGTRKYEMFSGGEAFRINFAIRIALSKLLARRAGAPLRTLIIDEGFGTQDNTAMEKVKEAINSIQDDFDKVLVITHMEELKDAFPARINVLKTAEGSTISLG